MLPLIAFLAAGTLGGILLGLIGVGMALVTVPLLIFTLPSFGFDAAAVPLIALATSMAVVSVGSVSSVLSHSKKGNVDWVVAKTTIPAGMIGIAVGTLLTSQLPGTVVRILFCGFLIVIALRMLIGRKASGATSHSVSPTLYRAAGASIGVAASVIGAGGGVLMVPFLTGRGHPMPRAVATSTLIGLPVSILGALIYAAQPVDLPQGLTLGYLFIPAFIGLSIGSALGAPIGVKLNSVISGASLKKAFSIILLIVAAGILLDL